MASKNEKEIGAVCIYNSLAQREKSTRFLTHYPAPRQQPEDDKISKENADHVRVLIVAAVAGIMSDEESSDPRLVDPLLLELQKSGSADLTYGKLIRRVKNGFPSTPEKFDPDVRTFWNVTEQLSLNNGLGLSGSRIVVPKEKMKYVLTRFHASNQGIDRTKRRARETVYWAGITSDIKNTVRACEPCK